MAVNADVNAAFFCLHLQTAFNMAYTNRTVTNRKDKYNLPVESNFCRPLSIAELYVARVTTCFVSGL